MVFNGSGHNIFKEPLHLPSPCFASADLCPGQAAFMPGAARQRSAIEIAQLPVACKRATLQPFLVFSYGPQLFLPRVTVFLKLLDVWPARLRREVAGAIRRDGASAAFAWLRTKAIIGLISVASSSAAARCSR